MHGGYEFRGGVMWARVKTGKRKTAIKFSFCFHFSRLRSIHSFLWLYCNPLPTLVEDDKNTHGKNRKDRSKVKSYSFARRRRKWYNFSLFIDILLFSVDNEEWRAGNWAASIQTQNQHENHSFKMKDYAWWKFNYISIRSQGYAYWTGDRQIIDTSFLMLQKWFDYWWKNLG